MKLRACLAYSRLPVSFILCFSSLFSLPSISCTDYQSRAMEIRCGQKKLGDREKKYVHMLNATLCATGRAICCLLENYQEKDGTRHCCVSTFSRDLWLMSCIFLIPTAFEVFGRRSSRSTVFDSACIRANRLLSCSGRRIPVCP